MLPESPERDARELELVFALRRVLFATRGATAPETAEVGARARALAQKSGNLAQLVKQVGGNCFAVVASGDYPSAAALADQTLDLARREGSDTSLRWAHVAQLGVRLVGAEEHFARLKGIHEASGYSQNPGEASAVMAYGGMCAWFLGQADAARERIAQGTTFARDANPIYLAGALGRESELCAWLREPARAEAAAAHALAIAEEHGFPGRDQARVQLGWARAQLGSAAEGVALIREGVAGMVERGARLGITGYLTLLAEAQAQGGAITDALATIEDALTANLEELVYRPQSLTCRGELRLTLGQRDLAEADFRDAIALARTMQAKAWELRATTRLARLLRDAGRHDEARTLLAEIYGRFTEGFDTRDLQDAKALLAELG